MQSSDLGKHRDIRWTIYLKMGLPDVLHACQTDRMAASICDNEEFWIQYNRIHFELEPEVYPSKVLINRSVDPYRVHLRISNLERYSAKEVAKMTHYICDKFYHDAHKYIRVKSLVILYKDDMLKHAINTYHTVFRTGNQDDMRWQLLVSSYETMTNDESINIGPLIEYDQISYDGDIVLLTELDFGWGFYTFTEPQFYDIIYTFPTIYFNIWINDSFKRSVYQDLLQLLLNPFTKSFLKYYKRIITQPTKYYDPTNGGFIIVNYDSKINILRIHDIHGTDLYDKLFIVSPIFSPSWKYHNKLMKPMIAQDYKLDINTITFYDDTPFDEFEKWILNYLTSDEQLETDPIIDVLFENYIPSVQVHQN
jgi:hypothetical protein